MNKCWASSHSTCSSKISREHYISAGIFDTQRIFVQGFDWCPQKKEVGLGSLTAKILCTKHNSALSKIDAVIKQTIKIINSSDDVRENAVYTLDGVDLEQWLLKTAVNLTFKEKASLCVGMIGAIDNFSAPYLLDVVFGDIEFSHKMGMYVLFPQGQHLHKKGELFIFPVHRNSEIGGMFFNLGGFYIFLSLVPGCSLVSLKELGIQVLPDHITDSISAYRPKSIFIFNGAGIKTKIELNWPLL